jgi:hypothetical protein
MQDGPNLYPPNHAQALISSENQLVLELKKGKCPTKYVHHHLQTVLSALTCSVIASGYHTRSAM